jgi:hypothetical protein
MTDEASVLERKTPSSKSEGPVDEFVYIPGQGDPAHTTVGGEVENNIVVRGYPFVAHVPQKLPRRTTTVEVLVRQERELPDGQIVSRSVPKRVPLFELLKDNPAFMINGVAPKPRGNALSRLPTDPDQYRGYAVGWIREARDAPTIQARWDGEEQLRERLGVSVSDLAFIVPFLQGRLLDLGGARTIPAVPL